MVPAGLILVLFLAYPLGKGFWLSFTDAKIGRTGQFIGLENYEWLGLPWWKDSDNVFWLSVFNTVLYTAVASVLKFGIGLYLALLLNQNLPFKALIRSIVLIPFVVPTVLSAIAFWWIFDSQFSIISWSLRHMGLIDHNINFLGDPNNARMAVIFANMWRGVPFIAITLLAGLQTVSSSLYEAATLDGAIALAEFPLHHLPAAHADHRGRDDLLGAVDVHGLPAHLGHDARRTRQLDTSDGDAVLPARHSCRQSRRGSRHRHRDGAVPALRDHGARGSDCSAANGSREAQDD